MYGACATAPEWLSAKAIADSDVVVRYQGLRHSLTSDPSRALMQMAISDPFSRIRRMAFGIYAELGNTADPAILRAFLFDRNSPLRQDAQRHWRDHGLGDPVDVYRKSVVEEPAGKTAEAVLGLGETGTPADAEFVLNCLNDHRSKVRSAAVRSICRLQPDAFLDIVTEALLKDGPAVANSAEVCLRKHVRRLEVGRLWNLAMSTTNPDSQVRVVRLFRQLGKWERLEYLLRSLVISDSVRNFALGELDDWSYRFNRSFATLTPAHRSSLISLLNAAKTKLSPQKVSEIEFVLR
jgi:hypothetical protein